MTTKRFRKPKIPVDPVVELPAPVLTPLEILLADDFMMSKAIEMATAGFSMSTIAAAIEVPVSTFIAWVKRGKANEEENPHMPEVLLWRELSKAWAMAKGVAEANLAKYDPKFFLTRGPSRLLGDDWSDESSTATKEKETLDVTQDLITALKSLRERGFDLNEIIDKDMLSVKTNTEIKPEVDLLEKHGINQVEMALPGPLAQEAYKLEQTLKLK